MKIDDNQINRDLTLPEIISLLNTKRLFILGFTGFFTLIGIAISLMLTPIFHSSAILSPVMLGDNTQDFKSGISGTLSSITGITGSSGSSEISKALAIFYSRDFTKRLINRHDILPDILASKKFDKINKATIYDKSIFNSEEKKWVSKKFLPVPTYLQAHEKLHKISSIKLDKDTGFVTISVQHLSPIFARQLIQIIVNELNIVLKEMTQINTKKNIEFLKSELSSYQELEIRQSISSLIESQLRKQMLASVKDKYLLEYIDPPYIPEKKSAPKRTVLTLIALFGSLFISISIVWVGRYYSHIKVKE